MKKILVVVVLLPFLARIYASPMHSHYKHNIVIDTDCAIDDMRAIAMLLSLPNVTVKAIIVSDGTLSPQDGVVKVRSLLAGFRKDSIPVFAGVEDKNINPAWRNFNRQLQWGNTQKADVANSNLDLVADIVEQSTGQVSFICLGPLTNTANILRNHKNIISNIEEIIWYTESATPFKGFNYACDTLAVGKILDLNIKTYVISNLDKPLAVFDTTMYGICKRNTTILAKALQFVHSQPEAFKKLKENHFRLWDELAVLFLANRELFSVEPVAGKNHLRYTTGYSEKAVREVMGEIIKGIYKPGEYVALYGFPLQPELYYYDVRQIMDSALQRYGIAEWKACVLTDEFHGHLGVYSIVGAKMGMRARDYFGIGTDLMTVVSYAGTKPPFSCMNDGIQVSTGATLGQGAISIVKDTVTRPTALFTYNNQTIEITLKKAFLEQVKADIKKGVDNYGLADEAYWAFVRQNALKYWLQWDRKEIFEVKVVK
ncbi:MAG TPA: nucleoside hydrolase [Bacteroidales bacterium]